MTRTDPGLLRAFRGNAGFTLLELLVVVGILAALVALALPYYQDYVQQSNITAAAADLNTFAKALASYDQLESSVFLGTNLLPLIGKYLQDYRKTAAQLNPRDPWGVEYTVRTDEGTIISGGPNGSINTAVLAREPAQDDILVTWKPEFFVSSAKAINATTIQVVFSRKVVDATVAAGGILTITNPAAGPSTAFTRVSSSIFRFTVPAMTVGNPHLVTMSGAIQAADKAAAGFDANPAGGGGNVITFTY